MAVKLLLRNRGLKVLPNEGVGANAVAVINSAV